MIGLSKDKIYNIHPLCVGKYNDVTLMSCIEGNIGRVWVNRIDNPTCAIVVAADFYYLLGKLNNIEYELFIKQLHENCRGKIIITDDFSFDSNIEQCFPNNFNRFNRYTVNGGMNLFNEK